MKDLYNIPFQVVGHGWNPLSLRASTSISIPVALIVGVVLFLVLQALVDRGDPKLVRAPRRSDQDTVGFD